MSGVSQPLGDEDRAERGLLRKEKHPSLTPGLSMPGPTPFGPLAHLSSLTKYIMLLSYTQLRERSAGGRPEPDRTPLKRNRPIHVRVGALRPLAAPATPAPNSSWEVVGLQSPEAS